jgi:hypothetical protein
MLGLEALKELLTVFHLLFESFLEIPLQVIFQQWANIHMGVVNSLESIATMASGLAGAFAIFALLHDRRKNRNPLKLNHCRIVNLDLPSPSSTLVLHIENRSSLDITVNSTQVCSADKFIVNVPESSHTAFSMKSSPASTLFESPRNTYPLKVSPRETIIIAVSNEHRKATMKDKHLCRSVCLDSSHGLFRLNIPKRLEIRDAISYNQVDYTKSTTNRLIHWVNCFNAYIFIFKRRLK